MQGHWCTRDWCTRTALTVIGASDLGEDAEGAGLGGACARVPVLGVLNQPLLAGVAVGGRVVELRVGIHDVLPRGAAQGQTQQWVQGFTQHLTRASYRGCNCDFSQHWKADSALGCRKAAAEAQLNRGAVFGTKHTFWNYSNPTEIFLLVSLKIVKDYIIKTPTCLNFYRLGGFFLGGNRVRQQEKVFPA